VSRGSEEVGQRLVNGPSRVRSTLRLVAAFAVVGLVAAAPARAIGTYEDPAGDSGTAGDVTGIEVESDASGQIVFRVSGSNLSTAPNQLTFLDIDSDANPLTGNMLAGGIDYFFGIDNESYGFFRWSGTDWLGTPGSTVTISGRGSALLISINRAELSNTSDFNFDLFTVDTTDVSAGDDAPADGMFNYSLDAGGPLISGMRTKASPAKPKAGKRFSVTVTGLSLPPSGRTAKTAILPERVSCVATLKGKKIASSCSFKLPKNARGKTLKITVTANYQGAKATKVLTFKVS
jgi:hypothetical protein